MGDMVAADYAVSGAGVPSNPCATAGAQYRNTTPTPHTLYFCPNTGGNINVEVRAAVPSPASGTLANFQVMTTGIQSSTGALTCTLNKAGASTGLTVTIAASAGANGASLLSADTTHTSAVTRGDALTIACVNAATVASLFLTGFSVQITGAN